MSKQTKRGRRQFSVAGRERAEWDTGALAELVLALARQRVAQQTKPKEAA